MNVILHAPGVLVARRFSGPRLRDQRRLAGVTVAQLAAHVGRSAGLIYDYEQGRAQPPVCVADALADALGLRLDVLLADDRAATPGQPQM